MKRRRQSLRPFIADEILCGEVITCSGRKKTCRTIIPPTKHTRNPKYMRMDKAAGQTLRLYGEQKQGTKFDLVKPKTSKNWLSSNATFADRCFIFLPSPRCLPSSRIDGRFHQTATFPAAMISAPILEDRETVEMEGGEGAVCPEGRGHSLRPLVADPDHCGERRLSRGIARAHNPPPPQI